MQDLNLRSLPLSVKRRNPPRPMAHIYRHLDGMLRVVFRLSGGLRQNHHSALHLPTLPRAALSAYVPGAEVRGHQLPRGSREKKEGMGWEVWTDLPTFIILFFFLFVYLHVVFDVNIP